MRFKILVSKSRSVHIAAVVLALLLSLSLSALMYIPYSSGAQTVSWNPAVECKPTVVSVETLVGNVPNPTQTLPNVGADYSGSIFRLAGDFPPGSNPNSGKLSDPKGLWPFSKRAPNSLNHDPPPPCSVTLSDGTAVSTLLEIHNVEVKKVTEEDNLTLANGWLSYDQTFTICNANLAPNCLGTYPDSMHRIHIEIDKYWNASGIAPRPPRPGDRIDVQGFVFWDPEHVNETWHNFSGWELHPVSAWRTAIAYITGTAVASAILASLGLAVLVVSSREKTPSPHS